MMMRALLIVLLAITSCGAASAMEVGTNFWDVGWGREANDPFVDPFVDGHKNVSGDNPWKSEFLEEIRVYSVFRFMDWGKTNNAVEAHGGKTRWEDDHDRTVRSRDADGKADQRDVGCFEIVAPLL